MPLQLRGNVHWCDSGGRAVFLDVEADRYFCLPAAANERLRLRLDHDEGNGIFLVTEPDGETAVFRDQPVQFLVVEPDPESGAMTPVMKHGEPTYLYLCRKEREGG